jgi:hypothetical protein
VLWARPAVRFGAPVLAVALVAIVWVAQREPEAPRPEATRAVKPMATTGSADQVVPAPSPELAPAPAAGREQRAQAEAPAVASGEALDAAPQREREREKLASVAAPQIAKEAPMFAAPPAAASAPAARKDEASRGAAKVGAAAVPAPTKVTVIKGGADTQEFTTRPEGESATDPRVAAIREGDYASRLLEDVVRPESDGPMRMLLSGPLTGGRVQVTRDGKGRWEILTDPSATKGPLAQPRLPQYRAGLAVELERALRAADPVAIERVRRAGLALLEESPGDQGTRALLEWCDAAEQALRTD